MRIDLTKQRWTLRGYRPGYWHQKRAVETDDHWQADVGPVPARVPLPAIVAALAMASVAGVLFGLWPAWRASRLDPVDALRYE